MGEEEEDTTIRGLTLWGSGVSGLSMHSMGAGAPPAPSGADSHQLLTLKQAVRELEATRDRCEISVLGGRGMGPIVASEGLCSVVALVFGDIYASSVSLFRQVFSRWNSQARQLARAGCAQARDCMRQVVMIHR